MDIRLKEIIESLIFVSLEPLSLEKIKSLLADFPAEEIEKAVAELLQSYASNQRGIQIVQAAGGFLFTTKPDYDGYIRQLLEREKKSRLSSAALEALSIIAYHQPVTLAQISALRGVDSSQAVRTLLEKNLIKIAGRKKAPGKPFLYRTTKKFLTYFGLNSLDDLPREDELASLLEKKQGKDDVSL
ncbi:MAG: SMC-Scp complex subunit ScpB [Candidatus Aminicenantes bacterium 4484_214]|nr:MAG: SMC-Scp complex subunit ScpB [Candidatus Aminicenantes bacterium 4484_214]HDJ24217.1 SMC-Scp complex subunit ScpB [Candidatus Aminicenantes bacterium]